LPPSSACAMRRPPDLARSLLLHPSGFILAPVLRVRHAAPARSRALPHPSSFRLHPCPGLRVRHAAPA
jgi:hypothetical protein